MLNNNERMYHIGLSKEDLQGATYAILPGDPGRVPKIAAHLENAVKLKVKREYISYLGEIDGNKVLEAAIFFLIYIIIWELVEFGADIYNEVTVAIIDANINKHYFNELYKIKPSILKENNTGYINGILHKVVRRQERAYTQVILHLPICIIYLIYFTMNYPPLNAFGV